MQRAPDLSLLLLSGGSLVGQNIVQALGARRRHVRLLATNSVPDEPSLQAFDEVLLVPATRTDELALHQALQPWLSAKSPLLVIPCRDDDSVFLAGLQNSAHLGKGCTLLVGAPEPAQAMRDKWLSWELAQRHDLPFAPTLVPLEADRIDAFVARWGFPLLVKPRSGFASQGVRVLLDQRQLAAIRLAATVRARPRLGTAPPRAPRRTWTTCPVRASRCFTRSRPSNNPSRS